MVSEDIKKTAVFTEREREVAQLLLHCQSMKCQMPQYGLSAQVLRQYKQMICKKMGCVELEEALGVALKLGLLEEVVV